MNFPLPGQLLSQVRCRRCRARVFDTRLAWRHCELSVADVVILCWRCDLLVGVKLQPEASHD